MGKARQERIEAMAKKIREIVSIANENNSLVIEIAESGAVSEKQSANALRIAKANSLTMNKLSRDCDRMEQSINTK